MKRNYLVILVFVLMFGLILPASAGPLADTFGDVYYPIGDETQNLATVTSARTANNFLKYDGYTSSVNLDKDAEFAYNRLKNDAVFVYLGHGNPGMILFESGYGGPRSLIVAQNVPGYNYPGDLALYPKYYLSDLNAGELKDVKFALFLSCYSGETGDLGNLVDIAFAKGADNVMGFKRTITNEALFEFNEDFWYYSSKDIRIPILNSATRAIRDYQNTHHGRTDGLESMYFRGRNNIDYLTPAAYGVV